MLNYWLLLTILFIAADWTAVWRGWRKINYFTKPTALFLMCIWFWTVSVQEGSALWFGLGLFFSLLGDIFLLFSYRYFIYGLTAFLAAQAAYIIGFNYCLPPISAPFWFLMIAQICVWAAIITGLVITLSKKSTHRKMILPAGIYAAALNAMLFSAIWTLFRPDWTALASSLAAGGALLFFSSDILLALDRFYHPFPHVRLWVRITYHLRQLALAAGAAQYGQHIGISLF